MSHFTLKTIISQLSPNKKLTAMVNAVSYKSDINDSQRQTFIETYRTKSYIGKNGKISIDFLQEEECIKRC
jgi:hypothetical protein